jgi:hypothetical protein
VDLRAIQHEAPVFWPAKKEYRNAPFDGRAKPILCGESMEMWKAAGDARSRARRRAMRTNAASNYVQRLIRGKIEAPTRLEIAPDCRHGKREKRLLIDEPIRGPHSLRVAIGGVDEFDVMAHHANHAKMRIDRSRNTFESLEKLLHFLMLAGSRMLVGRIELVFGQAALRIGTVRDGRLCLFVAVLILDCGNDCEQTHHRKKSTGAFLHV